MCIWHINRARFYLKLLHIKKFRRQNTEQICIEQKRTQIQIRHCCHDLDENLDVSKNFRT